MTSKAALCMALLEGRVLNIKNVFKLIGLTNAPREISRMIEKPFGVTVSRTPREGKSRYGQKVTWYDYRLNRTEHNMNGIIKMERYVEEHKPKPVTQQTPKPKKQLDLYGDL